MNRTRVCKAASPGHFWARDKAEGWHRADPDGQIPAIWPCVPVPLNPYSTQNLLSPHHAQAWSHQTLQSLKLCISAGHFDPLGSTRWLQPASSDLFFTPPHPESALQSSFRPHCLFSAMVPLLVSLRPEPGCPFPGKATWARIHRELAVESREHKASGG